MTRNITFTADPELIQTAREAARAENTTLNEQFRRWLVQYASKQQAKRAMETIDRIRKKYRMVGRKLTRDEMNERR